MCQKHIFNILSAEREEWFCCILYIFQLKYPIIQNWRTKSVLFTLYRAFVNQEWKTNSIVETMKKLFSKIKMQLVPFMIRGGLGGVLKKEVVKVRWTKTSVFYIKKKRKKKKGGFFPSFGCNLKRRWTNFRKYHQKGYILFTYIRTNCFACKGICFHN